MSLLKELQKEEAFLIAQQNQLEQRLSQLRALMATYKISSTPQEAESQYHIETELKSPTGKALIVPKTYDSKLQLVQKVYFVIRQLKKANVHEIAAELQKLDPKYKKKAIASKASANGAFKLSQTGVLDKEQQGKQVYYSIKK